MAEKVYNTVIYHFIIIFSKLPSTVIYFIKEVPMKIWCKQLIIPTKGSRKHSKIKSMELKSVFNVLRKVAGKNL